MMCNIRKRGRERKGREHIGIGILLVGWNRVLWTLENQTKCNKTQIFTQSNDRFTVILATILATILTTILTKIPTTIPTTIQFCNHLLVLCYIMRCMFKKFTFNLWRILLLITKLKPEKKGRKAKKK